MSDENERSVAADGSIENAWGVLSSACIADKEWAWAVLCHLACQIMDEGVSHEPANKAASRIMRALFDFDVEQLDEWKEFPWESERLAEQ